MSLTLSQDIECRVTPWRDPTCHSTKDIFFPDNQVRLYLLYINFVLEFIMAAII